MRRAITGVLCICLLYLHTAAQQQRPPAAGRPNLIPAAMQQLRHDSLRVEEVAGTTVAGPDSLFNNVVAAQRYLLLPGEGADSVYVYFFEKKFTEQLVYGLLTDERPPPDGMMPGCSIIPFYTDAFLGFIFSRSVILNTQLLQRLLPATSGSTAQFDLLLTETDDSQWLEKESKTVLKRKKRG